MRASSWPAMDAGWPASPSNRRAKAASTIRGEVEGTDGYGKTAVIAVEAARRLVADGAKSGVLTPAQA